MRGDILSAWRWWSVNKVGVGFDRHKGSVEFHIKRGAGVVANERAEGRIRSGRAATAKTIAEKASPANPLTCPCEPLVDSATA